MQKENENAQVKDYANFMSKLILRSTWRNMFDINNVDLYYLWA